MSGRVILALTVAAALMSCKADLEHHAPDDGGRGDTVATGGIAGGTGGAAGSGGKSGTGGIAAGTGGTAGTGGIAVGTGGAAGTGGTGPGTGGSAGHATGGVAGAGSAAGTGGGAPAGTGGIATATGGMSGTGGTGGSGGSAASGGQAGTPGGTGGVPPCTLAETRCEGASKQTCGANGTWGTATACESGTCLGTNCLPKTAILVFSIPTVFAYDAQTGAFASSFDFAEKTVFGATIGPDGKLWVIDTIAKTIVRYELSGKSLGIFATLKDYGDYLAFGPDGNLYASARTSPRTSIVRINATTGATMGTFMQSPLDLGISGMAFHDGSLFVTYSGSGDALGGSLYQYDGSTGAFVKVVYDKFSPYGPETPAFAPDGTIYVPVWQSPDVGKIDGKTLTFIANISQTNLNATSIAFAPDGKLLILSDPLGGSASVVRYDPKLNTFTTLVPTGSGGVGRAHTIIYR